MVTSAPAISSSVRTACEQCSTGSSSTSATRSRTSVGSAFGHGASGRRWSPGASGSRDQLVEAYEAAGGQAVDPAALRWWEVMGTFTWGVICMMQAAAHRSGLSAVGRVGGHRPAGLRDRTRPVGPACHDGAARPLRRRAPDEEEPCGPARRADRGGVARGGAGVPRRRRHVGHRGPGQVPHAVAVNVLAMLEREAVSGPPRPRPTSARLKALGYRSEQELAAAIRRARSRCPVGRGQAVGLGDRRRQARRRQSQLRRRSRQRAELGPEPAADTHTVPGVRIGILGGTGPAGSAPGGAAGRRPASTSSSAHGRSTGPWRPSTSCSAGGRTATCTSWPPTTRTPRRRRRRRDRDAVGRRHPDRHVGRRATSTARSSSRWRTRVTRIGKEFQPLVPPRGSVAASVQAAVPRLPGRGRVPPRAGEGARRSRPPDRVATC